MRYTRQVRANVLAEMGRRELKQGDVAQILNTSQRSVSKRMTGDTDWRIGDLLRLAQAWDIPIGSPRVQWRAHNGTPATSDRLASV